MVLLAEPSGRNAALSASTTSPEWYAFACTRGAVARACVDEGERSCPEGTPPQAPPPPRLNGEARPRTRAQTTKGCRRRGGGVRVGQAIQNERRPPYCQYGTRWPVLVCALCRGLAVEHGRVRHDKAA
eukprot:349874-Chlamydomonas_euryale.AAC.2